MPLRRREVQDGAGVAGEPVARDGVVGAREPIAGERVVAAREPVAGERVVRERPVAEDRPVRRRGAGLAAVGEGALALARIVQLITAAVVGVILLAIAFVLLDANASNSIVSTVHDIGNFFVGPFKDIFSDKDPKVAIAENWGIAALIYLIVGTLIANFIARLAAPRTAV